MVTALKELQLQHCSSDLPSDLLSFAMDLCIVCVCVGGGVNQSAPPHGDPWAVV